MYIRNCGIRFFFHESTTCSHSCFLSQRLPCTFKATKYTPAPPPLEAPDESQSEFISPHVFSPRFGVVLFFPIGASGTSAGSN